MLYRSRTASPVHDWSSYSATAVLFSTTRRQLTSLVVAALIIFGSVYPAQGQTQPSIEAAVATNCTWFAAHDGRSGNSGTNKSDPLTLDAAHNKVDPGDVVCLLPGTYNQTRTLFVNDGGSASAYITYKSYDPAAPALLKWAGTSEEPLIKIDSNAAYLEFQGLKFDGSNKSPRAIQCLSGHHIRIIGNNIRNTGSGGISGQGCDYLSIIGNTVFHTGYTKGWSSGIALNSMVWYNQNPGFHSVVVNNIVAGTYDGSSYHSDGNGIIMDRGENTPPVLIANNLVYMNGGRCIHTYRNKNKWIINNTCYANSLDGQIAGGSGSVGEYQALMAENVYFINNVVQAWAKGYPFRQGQSTGVQYYRNAYFGGKGLIGMASTVKSDVTQLWQVTPQFRNPIQLDPSADGQYRNALDPDLVADRFQLQASSPLIDAGIDPRTLPGLSPEIKAGIEQYVLTALDGTLRPQGTGFDIGAYELVP